MGASDNGPGTTTPSSERTGTRKARQAAPRELLELGLEALGEVGVVAVEDDKSVGALAVLFVWPGDDGDLPDRRVGGEGGLDGERRGVLAAAVREDEWTLSTERGCLRRTR